MGEAHADSADALRQELDLASRALREGDPAQAVRHLARAHERAPTEPSVQAAFAAVADTAGVDDAIVALAQIAEERPASGLEVVLASWLDAAARRGHTGPAAADRIARLLSTVSASTVGLHRLRPGERALLGGHGDLARAFAQRVTDDAHVATVAGVLRRTGGCDEALRLVGDRGHESCLVQRGLALRTQGHGASAAQAFAAAARTTDHKVFSVEEARSWFVAGDLARARALLEPLLPAADPETNWLAEACTQGGGGDPVAALDRWRRVARAPALSMSDVTAVTLRDHVLGSADPIVQTQVRGWESPSNRLLAGLFSVGYTLSVPELPFDPVTPRRGTATPLWVRRGGDLVVGVPAPPVGLGHAIAAVAEGDDAVEDLWDRAAQLSSTLDPTCAAQLAASMVHPPLDVAWLRSTPDGLFRHQVACACVLASLPHGWPTTRPIFEALLFGPVDWTSSAAIVALGQLAQRDASAAHEALALLSDTVADLLPHPAEPRFVPLSRVLKALPCVAPAQIDALDSWRNAFIHDPASDEEDSLTAPAVAPKSDRRPLLLGPVLLVVGLLLATLLRRCTSLH